MHVIESFNKLSLPPGTLKVTCNVESLYSNIGHDIGIGAVKYFLEKQTSGDPPHNAFL